MSLIALTVVDDIVRAMNNLKSVGVMECKIPVCDYPSGKVLEILNQITLEASKNKFELRIHIAAPAMKQFCDSDQEFIYTKHAEWVNDKGNLTFYRNKLATDAAEIHGRVLQILVGCDCIADQASVEHIRDYGSQSIWSNVMRQQFTGWLKLVASDALSTKEAKDCDKLLEVVYKYTDLNVIDDYLQGLDDNGRTLFAEISYNLDSIGLCRLINVSVSNTSKRSVNFVFKQIENMMNVQSDVFDSKVSVVDRLIKDIERKDVDWRQQKKTKFLNSSNNDGRFGDFDMDDPHEFLEAVKDVLVNGRSSAYVNRLRACDGFTLIYDVLGYKGETKTREKGETEVVGMPLEAVCQALWESITRFASSDDVDRVVTKVRIVPDVFIHNTTEKEALNNEYGLSPTHYLFIEHVAPSFSGLDSYIVEKIWAVLMDMLDGKRFSNMFGKSEIEMTLGDRIAYDSESRFSSKFSQLPCLHFSVIISCEDESANQIYKFKWKQQANEATIYSMKLARHYNKLRKTKGNNEMLPVFSLETQKYKELFLKDDSSVIDYFNSRIKNLDLTWIDVNPEVGKDNKYYTAIKRASDSFCDFISEFCGENDGQCGLYHTLDSPVGHAYIKSYQELFDNTGKQQFEDYTTLATKIFRSFWLLDGKDTAPERMETRGFKSGIVTILHPALVELVTSQSSFFCDQFVKNLKMVIDNDLGSSKFGMWERMTDFARLTSPIACVMDESNILSTVWRGTGLFFRIGELSEQADKDIPLSTMIKFKEEEDNAIPDSAFTRVTEESRLIRRLIRDFYSTYSYAYDGLRLSVVFPPDVQPVFSAILLQIRSLVTNFDKSEPHKKLYHLYPMKILVNFYFEGESEYRLAPWVSQFNEYFEGFKAKDDKYSMIDFSVGYKSFVSKPDSMYETLAEIFEQDGDSDIILLYESEINKTECSTVFYELPKFDDSSCPVQFPMLEKNLPRQRSNPNESRVRRCSLISNRQFALNSAFMRYARMISGNIDIDARLKDVIVKEEVSLGSWQKILYTCLDHAERVIVIGPDIDKDIVKGKEDSTVIVGFGSGIGSNANLNYAVASKIIDPSNLKSMLARKFSSHFNVDIDDTLRIIDNLYEASNQMADLSLVRTVGGLGYYMNDFFGYSMIRHMLKTNPTVGEPFCDVVISLDSYRHWIGVDTEDNMRADLIWLVAYFDTDCNRFKLKLSIIESKVSENIVQKHYLDKAKMQVDKTLVEIAPKFMPARGDVVVIAADGNPEAKSDFLRRLNVSGEPQCDSRYWWMQLYRIIASNTTCSDFKDRNLIQSFENLAEGDFDIEWHQDIICFDTHTIPSGVAVFKIASSGMDSIKKNPLGDWVTNAYVFSRPALVNVMGNDVKQDWESYKAEVENNRVNEDLEYIISYKDADEIARKDNADYKQSRDGTFEEQNLVNGIDFSTSDDEEPDDETFAQLVSESEEPLFVSDAANHVEATFEKIEGVNVEHSQVVESGEERSFSRTESGSLPSSEESLGKVVMPDSLKKNEPISNVTTSPVSHPEGEGSNDEERGPISNNPNLPDAKILIGTDVYTNKPVYWYYGTNYKLPNRHVFIVGSSGGGKSYALQTILAELARIGECSLIIDYTDGFTGEYIEPQLRRFVSAENDVYVRESKLAINPFKRQVVTVKTASGREKSSQMSIAEVAEKVASIFQREYKDLGARQIAALRNVIVEGLETYGDAFDMRQLGNMLSEKADGKPSDQIAGLIDRIGPFCRLDPFSSNDSEDGWSKYFKPGEDGSAISIIQLANIDSQEAQHAVVEFILWDLWYYMNPSRSSKNTPHMIVLDEIQSMSFDDSSPVLKYMKEGRKRGLSLIAATQSFKGISAKVFLDSLGNAATKIFFRPTESDTSTIAKILHNIDSSRSDKEWAEVLSNLRRGQCVVVTSDEKGRTRTSLVNIDSFEKRGL